MFRLFAIVLGFTSVAALADVPGTFVGFIRCSANIQRYNLDHKDSSSSKVFELVLSNKGYNSWRNDIPVSIDVDDGYRLQLPSVSISVTRHDPLHLRLRYLGQFSRVKDSSQKVLAVGVSEEGSVENSVGMPLLSTEEAQAYSDSKNLSNPDDLIKQKFIPDNYVTKVYVACSLVYNK